MSGARAGSNRRWGGGAVGILLAFALAWTGPAWADAPEDPAPRISKSDAYYHLMQATLAARRGELRRVERELAKAAEFDPASAELRAEAAGLLLAMGQRDPAGRWAREALTLDPAEPTALRILGDLAYARAFGGGGSPEAVEEAIGYFQALTRLPDAELDDGVFEALFQLERQRGNVAAAIEHYIRFADRRPGDLLAHRQLIALLTRVGRTEDAFERLLAFVERYGEIDAFATLLSGVVERADQWSRLADVLEKRREREAPSEALDDLIVESYLRAGRYREAARELEARPGESDFRRDAQLAAAYAAGGRLADAAELYRRLRQRRPDDADLSERLGQTLFRQRDLEGAIEAWSTALEKLEGAGDAETSRDLLRWRIAMAELDRDAPAEARRWIELLERPADRDLLALRFRVALAEEDLADARRTLLALEPLEAPGRFELMEGELALRSGNEQQAERAFRRAVEKLGSAAIPRVAELWRREAFPGRAETLLTDWARREPDEVEAHFALGRFMERRGRLDEAERALDRALELDPGNAELQNYLGYALADGNRKLEKALRLIDQALRQDPWNAAYLDSLGWAYFRMGDLDRARGPLERAAREYPYDAVVIEHLGDWHHAKGDLAGAIRLWRRALGLRSVENPERLEAKIRRSEAERSAVDRSGSRDDS